MDYSGFQDLIVEVSGGVGTWRINRPEKLNAMRNQTFHAIIELGGGRHSVGETLDLSVGLTDIASIGTLLDEHTPLAVVHAASEADAEQAEALLLAACTTGEEAPETVPVISEILTGND